MLRSFFPKKIRRLIAIKNPRDNAENPHKIYVLTHCVMPRSVFVFLFSLAYWHTASGRAIAYARLSLLSLAYWHTASDLGTQASPLQN